jgi:hypothetical protein
MYLYISQIKLNDQCKYVQLIILENPARVVQLK